MPAVEVMVTLFANAFVVIIILLPGMIVNVSLPNAVIVGCNGDATNANALDAVAGVKINPVSVRFTVTTCPAAPTYESGVSSNSKNVSTPPVPHPQT